MKQHHTFSRIHLVLAALLTLSAHVRAESASTTSISFQAALTGDDGQPLLDGTYDLTFQFWDGPSPGGTSVSGEILVSAVSVVGGVASTAIPVDPAWCDGQNLYLGVGVNGASELTPRILVTAVPYALDARTLGGGIVQSTGNILQIGPTDTGAAAVFVRNASDPAARRANFVDNGGIVQIRRNAATSWPSDSASVGLIVWTKSSLKGNLEVDGVAEFNEYVDIFDRLRVFGSTSTEILTITGGSDLAEPFDVTGIDTDTQVPPGMVMVISGEEDGKLTPCTSPYDTAVAGIISGANGLQPGMVMQAEGNPMAEGEYPLAMAGRVWCLADASFGPIHRGDRLTTSSAVGHAMKVTDASRSDGTVIGKAMSELVVGTGLVLVLVNLQ